MTTRFAPPALGTLQDTSATAHQDAPFTLADRLIPGSSAPMRQVKRLVTMLAPADGPVLVTGQSGSGKELVAQALHRLSGRKGQLVAVNCAALPAELLEGELFGSERGAYTGADRARPGLIEQAEGGTLFLDEIGDMPLGLQAKLLRVLETRMVRRLGGAAPVRMDFRVVAATHRDLDQMVAEGTFRQDLLYRLSVFPVQMPALAQHIADLPEILGCLLDDLAVGAPGQPMPEFDDSAMRSLMAHDWPGNVRELRTVAQRACLLFPGRRVTAREVKDNLFSFAVADDGAGRPWPQAPHPAQAGLPAADHFRDSLAAGLSDLDLRCYLRDIEVALITAALDRHDGCVSRAAHSLRLRRTTLIEKMRKYGVGRGA
ncbi:sigma-54 interaction domain-containing protein [Paracoccus sp. T5]|uniref:sigma-54 interaction domain-containing protein n=1 Tax=Paracoccus sp. T5 TaxID=3402161 RepID=UPI003AD9C277